MTTKKVARLEVRIPPDVKAQFSDNCSNEGKNSSEVIRDFIYQKITPNEEVGEGHNKKNLMYAFLATFFMFLLGGGYSYSQPDPDDHEILYLQFNSIDKNRDGVLTLSDFEILSKKLLKKFSSHPEKFLMLQGLNTEERTAKLEKLKQKHHPTKRMNYYDVNQDNIVTFKEFISLPPQFNSIKWKNFYDIDTNKDNYLSYEELFTYAKQWFSYDNKAQKRATYSSKQRMLRDINGDNQLSLEEYKTPIAK